MKVLLLAEYDKMGGTRTYFKQLLNLYYTLGWHVTVVRSFLSADDEIDSLLRGYGFNCHNVSELYGRNAEIYAKFPFGIVRERWAFKRLIRALKPDVVVVSVGTPGLFAGVMTLAGRALYILHTYQAPTGGVHVWKNWIKAWIYRIVFRRGKYLLTVSDYAKACISRSWGLQDRGNLHVIHSTAGDIVRMERPRNRAEQLTVLTLGHVVPYKNPTAWVKVAQAVIKKYPKPIRFVWLGEGELLGTCQSLVQEAGLERTVEFLGLKADVEKYYADCDIYFQPSLIESLGLSVLDAQRHGIPCVVAARGGLSEIVVDGQNGWLVEPDDIDVMSTRILDLLSNSSLRQRMSENARVRYLEKFSPGVWREKMMAIHSSLMNGNAVAN